MGGGAGVLGRGLLFFRAGVRWGLEGERGSFRGREDGVWVAGAFGDVSVGGSFVVALWCLWGL